MSFIGKMLYLMIAQNSDTLIHNCMEMQSFVDISYE